MEKSPCSAPLSVRDNNDLNLRLALPGTEYESEHPSSSSSSCFNTNNKRPSSQIQTKARVVGWPPVRKTAVQQRRREAEGGGVMVKVSMDGAPYLRKIDMNQYHTYSDLLKALDCMFSCTIGSESCTYQDKDGDWMLVGDVPMEMFVTSCKRLRIIKPSQPKQALQNLL